MAAESGSKLFNKKFQNGMTPAQAESRLNNGLDRDWGKGMSRGKKTGTKGPKTGFRGHDVPLY